MYTRNPELIKEKSVKAALKLILENGFDKFRLIDLEKETKISVVTLRKYFKTRDKILEAIFSLIWEELMTIVFGTVTIMIACSQDIMLKSIIVSVFGFFQDNYDYCSIFIREGKNVLLVDKKITGQDNFIQLIQGIVTKGKEDGIFKSRVPVNVARVIIWSFLEAILSGNILSEKCATKISKEDFEKILEQFIKTIMD